MTIAIVGRALPTGHRRALEAAGLRIAPVARAVLRVWIGAKPPARPPAAPWVWCATREPAPGDAAAAVLAGAYDCVLLDRTLAEVLARRLAELRVRPEPGPPPVGFVAHSAAAKRVIAELDRAARTSMAVLLTGETGTGKDLAARHLHARSGRRGDFVPINCAAIPNDLIEGELFGYVRGAFSGAIADYDGLLRGASGGTVFLDEVDDTPTTVQVKLLRVLEDHVVSRLGENVWRQVDFRVVAATNRDLAELVRTGELGADLYQRLAIIRIELPPLRDRRDDLPELCAHLLARFYREEPAAPHRVTALSAPALAALRRCPWPGNVRELRNVLFQALVHKRAGDELLLSDLPERIVRGEGADAPRPAGVVDRSALARLLDAGHMNLRAVRDELERTALELALARCGGSPARAAKLLGEVGRGSSSDPGGTVRAMRRRLGVWSPLPAQRVEIQTCGRVRRVWLHASEARAHARSSTKGARMRAHLLLLLVASLVLVSHSAASADVRAGVRVKATVHAPPPPPPPRVRASASVRIKVKTPVVHVPKPPPPPRIRIAAPAVRVKAGFRAGASTGGSAYAGGGAAVRVRAPTVRVVVPQPPPPPRVKVRAGVSLHAGASAGL